MPIIFLLFFFCFFQTWRTSRRREEMQWGSERAKEWSCCAARRLTLEVIRSAPICLSCLCICPVAALRPDSFVLHIPELFEETPSVCGRMRDARRAVSLHLFVIVPIFIWSVGSCVCALPSDLLTVCLRCGGQRSESFLLWDTRGLSAWFPVGDQAKLWHADWGGCLRLGPGQAE